MPNKRQWKQAAQRADRIIKHEVWQEDMKELEATVALYSADPLIKARLAQDVIVRMLRVMHDNDPDQYDLLVSTTQRT